MSRDDLIRWRKRREFTQVEAADYLGYSERHYQRFEAGDAALPPPLVKRLEVAVGKIAE